MTTLETIKQLRKETGLSFALIKEVVETHKDIETSRTYLMRLRIEDKHEQVAKKGVCIVAVKHDISVMFEVNAMTDFVTSHLAFKTFITELQLTLLNHPMTPFENVSALPLLNSSVDDARIKLEMLIGEHVKISRVSYVRISSQQVFGVYQHHNYRSASLVVIDNNQTSQNEHLHLYAKHIAKHVASLGELHPKWKHTILDQIYASTFFDTTQTVKAYLEEVSGTLVFASRYELGETMEEHLSCSLLKKEACSS